jgi:hypothetical protein
VKKSVEMRQILFIIKFTRARFVLKKCTVKVYNSKTKALWTARDLEIAFHWPLMNLL